MSEFKQQELFWSNMFDAEDRLIAFPSFHMSDSALEHDALNTSNSIHTSLRSDVSLRIMTMANQSPMAVYLVLLVGIKCLLHKYTGKRVLLLVFQPSKTKPMKTFVWIKSCCSNKT